MNEKENKPVNEVPAFVKKAPELLPVWDWWVKEGKSTVLMLIVAGVAVGGFYGVKNWLTSRNAAANHELVNAFNADELEAAVSSYGSTKVGPALKLRLAKAYFDGERYQDALDTYEGLLGKMKSGEAFYDVAAMGRAHSLEGLGKFDEAKKAFDDYAAEEANKDSYLRLTAKLGAARCVAQLGDKDGAVKALEKLNDEKKDDLVRKARIERLIDVIKRYDPKRMQRSLFDAADDAAKAVDSEKKSAPAKVEGAQGAAVKPVTAPKAPAEKPATKK